MEGTSKETMTNYLERFQMYQRLLQGMAHVYVEMLGGDRVLSSVTLNIFPLDEEGGWLRDEHGEIELHHFCVCYWEDESTNEKIMGEAKEYIQTFNVA